MQEADRLREIRTFPQLVKYLKTELDWPIDTDDFEELTFEYAPEELGLDAKAAVKVKDIKQLRPLTDNQPWGIFFVNFEPKRLPVVVLRRILRALVINKRASAKKSQQQTWQSKDLLFISSYGEHDHRDISFAQFSEGKEMQDLPVLRVLGWDDEDTVSHLAHAHEVLKEKLTWPRDPEDITAWREQWSAAFTLRHREVITTSRDLAIRMAELATSIRKRANRVLDVESENGPMCKLMTAFREALIHDLKPDDFADMYAQTITYGLLSARVSRPMGVIAENIRDMVPITNTFLRDLLSEFLTVGGRKGRIDFDELGINDVVESLNEADMEAVLRDFGDKNPEEDPVIHFYELFLKEYDSRKKIERGVFYTPRPVVSFIVRSVHEILQKEFGLEDGLADISTWGDFQKRFPDLKIPKDASSKDPFVKILDPACGTGTFLVESIDLIHKTMIKKWEKQGCLALEIPKLWNEYVPEHLLPRIYGFELMMAPYAVAHMKLGIKLYETGYKFRSHERARIYLTNSLEDPKDFSDTFEFDIPALAHEAKAANVVKESVATTIVLGNPPYKGMSLNSNPWINGLLKGKLPNGNIVSNYYEVDGEPLDEANPKWLQDDYVKFIRCSQWRIESADAGILAFISNHGYLDNPTFRGMRQSLMKAFENIYLIDLHGNLKKKEKCPDGSDDNNVFDIQQGVAIGIFVKNHQASKVKTLHHSQLYGLRKYKYQWLLQKNLAATPWKELKPQAPFHLFVPQDTALLSEYGQGWKIAEIMPVNSVGIVTARDELTIAWTQKELWERVNDFAKLPVEQARENYQLGKDARDWKVAMAQQDLKKSGLDKKKIVPILYRPFDTRFTCYTGHSRGFICMPRPEVMRHMMAGENLGLITVRQQSVAGEWSLAGVSNIIIEACAVSNRTAEINYLFPIYLYANPEKPLGEKRDWPSGKDGRWPNLDKKFVEEFSGKLGMEFDPELCADKLVRRSLGEGGSVRAPKRRIFGPEDVFNYIYAIFHSPEYRRRYAEFLKFDFPRVPFISNKKLFSDLCVLGEELIGLHLLESKAVNKFITSYPVKGFNLVEKGYPKFSKGSIFINQEQYFKGVPEEVWNFHIGGYQVCDKWLKDRRGRTLIEEDIAHYQKVVVALSETIRLMAEIDKVIDSHGGWPIK